MRSRSLIGFALLVGALGIASTATAQTKLAGAANPAHAGFVKLWKGNMSSIGDIELTITSIDMQGKVTDCGMNFLRQAYKFDCNNPNAAVSVSGSKLTVVTPNGGTYDLTLVGATLGGTYNKPGLTPTSITFK